MVFPWGEWFLVPENLYLVFILDMLRLGLGLFLFIIPGALIFLLLKRTDATIDRLGLLPIGFALSVTLIEFLGLFGRVAGLSFSLVRGLFILAGAAVFAVSALSRSGAGSKRDHGEGAVLSRMKNYHLILALLFAFFFTFHDYQFFIDDTTYGAYLTNWQYSSRLGFTNIVHETQSIEISRFWLAMFPMSQSLLAAVSGIHGLLLLANYLELFLAVLAVLTLFWFMAALGISHWASGFAALIQVLMLVWMQGEEWPIGTWFFQSLSEDKVAAVFLLAPVFFFLVLEFIQHPSVRALALVAASGFGIMLAHPVILFLTCVIAVELALFAWISKRITWRTILPLGMVLVILMLPYAVIRISDRTGEVAGPYDGKTAATTFMIDQYTNVISDVFYGLNPGVLKFVDLPFEGSALAVYQWIRLIPFYLLILAGILSLAQLRQGQLYWYLSASILLVMFAALPYTGWILGYFVSARLISRAAWFSPLGLGAVVLLRWIWVWVARRTSAAGRSRFKQRRLALWVTPLFFFLGLPFLLINVVRAPLYFDWLNKNLQRAQIGRYIDQHSEGPVVVIALDYEDLLLLPTMSADVRLISFREELDYNGFNNSMPIEQIRARIAASNAIRSMEDGATAAERCDMIRRYGVRYLIAPANRAGEYRALLGDCGRNLKISKETEDLVLFEFG